jgi:hypothetical protein
LTASVATIPWYLSKLRDSTNVSSPVVMCLHLVAIPSQRQRAGHECADSAGILHAVSISWASLPHRQGESSMPSIIHKITAKTSPFHALLVAKLTDSGYWQ